MFMLLKIPFFSEAVKFWETMFIFYLGVKDILNSV